MHWFIAAKALVAGNWIGGFEKEVSFKTVHPN